MHWGVRLASYLLMGFALLIIMLNGLLVGLLAACVGYTFTQFLVRKIADASRQPFSLNVPPPRWIEYLAVTIVLVVPMDGDEGVAPMTFSANFACPECGYSMSELEPRIFSFNNPAGACPTCDGLGVHQYFDPA